NQISNVEAIKKLIGKPEILAYDLYLHRQCIGFAMLRKYSSTDYFLWDYAIDCNYQNRCYGTMALRQLIEFMKFKFHTKELTTTYLWGNEHAKHVYEKVGFIETDVVDEDDIHEVNMIKYL
nr:GNAT family N-acetyltransferase [Anaeroplasmataceae bacterium]